MNDPYLPLECWGKLPCDEEYLASRSTSPAVKAVQNWVIEGREEALASQEVLEQASVREQLSYRFVLSHSGSGDLAAGVIRPSHDRKPRHFPFVTMVHFSRRQFAGRFDVLAMALEPVWEALDDAWTSLAVAPTVEAFRERVDSLSVPAPIPFAEAEARLRAGMRDSSERLFGPVGEADLGALEEGMPLVVQRIRQSSTSDPTVLQLPISTHPERALLDTAFWVALFNRQFFWRRIEPTIFIGPTQGGRNPSCQLFVSGLSPTHYRWLMGLDPLLRGLIAPASDAGSRTLRPAVTGPFPSYQELVGKRFRG